MLPLIAAVFTAATSPAPNAVEQAQALENAGDDRGALRLLTAAVVENPTWAIGRVELGRLELKLGETDAAFAQLDIARSLAPENPRAHYLFALAADDAGHRNESRRALEVALALRSGYADAQQRLASVLVAEGDFAGASVALRAYLSAHPDANGARLQLADALERAGSRKEAEAELRTLIEVPALKTLAGRRLVALLEAAGRQGEAEKLRVKLDPPKRQLRDLKPSKR
ncbi:MAG: tetratricopeptide repeat protein [Myxococcaceae bacterium]